MPGPRPRVEILLYVDFSIRRILPPSSIAQIKRGPSAQLFLDFLQIFLNIFVNIFFGGFVEIRIILGVFVNDSPKISGRIRF